jgi:alcohol dehydrogenase class IV
MPVSLPELEIPADKFEEMAAKCTAAGPRGNFVPLTKEDVVKIYQSVLN